MAIARLRWRDVVLFGLTVAVIELSGCAERQTVEADVPALPDDAVFAFGTSRDGNGEVYLGTVAPVAGVEQFRNLTHDSTFDGSPAWSPDGSRIAFDSDRTGDHNREIFVMNADGSDVRRLTHDPGFDYLPAWSPDGEWIAFVSTRDSDYDPTANNAEDFRGQLYRVHPDGTGLERMTESAAHDQSPSWSPDGRQIVFCRDEGGVGEVYVLDIATREETVLTNTPSFDCSPAWSPDGKRIAFTSEVDLRTRLVIMSADGSDVRPVALGMRNASEPSWSPDGGWICVTGEVAQGKLFLFAVRRDGGATVKLTDGPTRDQSCAFQPLTAAAH